MAAEEREPIHAEIMPQALELIQRAEIDMQIATAKKYPRDLAKVKRRMLDFATLDEETAESCFYTLSRSGKTIQGPSVRLAEIAVACYQNLRAASRVIDNNGRTITCQGACHDLENNTLISVEVQRRITDRNGKTYNEDMQVVAGNAGNSIAFRNAVFKVVPGALLKPVYEAAKRVAVGDASTLTTRRAKIISRLNSMQVDTQRILSKIGKSSVENIGLEDLEVLIGLGTAIKDGDTTVDESFPLPKPTVSVDQFNKSSDPNRGHDNAAADASADEVKSIAGQTKEPLSPAVVGSITDHMEKQEQKLKEPDTQTLPLIPTYDSWEAVKAAFEGDEYHADLGKIIGVGGKTFTRETFEATWSPIAPNIPPSKKRNSAALDFGSK